jgi:hypothetical protein
MAVNWAQPNKKIVGRNWNAGDAINSGDYGSNATDMDFVLPTRNKQTAILQRAQSSANPDDIAAMDSVRGALDTQMANMNYGGDLRGSALDTQTQRGLKNLLSQYKAQNAGSGRIGSSQYGRGQGDVAARVAEEYTKGVNDLAGNQIDRIGKIQAGYNGLYGQDLQERSFQNNQAKSLVDLLETQMGNDQAREGKLLANKPPETNWLASAMPIIGAGVGTLVAPGVGTSIGASLGGQVGSQMQGGQGGGGGNGALIAALANAQKQQPTSGGSFMNDPAAWQYGSGGSYGGYSY